MNTLIEKARELSSAATEGPWDFCCDEHEVTTREDGDLLVRVPFRGQGTCEDLRFIAESRTLLPALADLAESEGKRADEAERERLKTLDFATVIADERDKARAAATALTLENARLINEAGNAHKEAAVLRTNRDRIAFGEAEALKMMAAEKRRADAAEQELTRIKGAALTENIQAIARVHDAVEEHRASYGVQSRDGYDAHAQRGELLDAARALTAERDGLCAALSAAEMTAREQTEIARLATETAAKRTQELLRAETELEKLRAELARWQVHAEDLRDRAVAVTVGVQPGKESK